jgi:hypothetical protein
MRGGPYSDSEKIGLLDYCESDVQALSLLLPKMTPAIDIYQACTRGRYMCAAAKMEFEGIPVDLETYAILRSRWEFIQRSLIEEIDLQYGVYEGMTFKTERFRAYLASNDIPWPRLASGALALDDGTFKSMSVTYPQLAAIRDLRSALSNMRLIGLHVGDDGCNRAMLSAFRSKTGRNQPSNSNFLFGPAVWLRGLIRAPEGHGIAYIDWSQQEFGIAAALSGDELMKAAYRSGDPYLAFAIQAGAAPSGATKHTHKHVREQFKACVLAVQYGMGEDSLALRINQPVARARELLQLHKTTYSEFWKWSDASLDSAMLNSKLETVLGWSIRVGKEVNPRSLRNFPMQANGAEMLRLACCELTEAGVRVCAPVHDAVLIIDTVENLSISIEKAQGIMGDVSELILNGFRLESDADVFCHPQRYSDPRGEQMWKTVTKLAAA